MSTQFSERQRQTLTAVVDTFVPALDVDDDPTGFFATKGSDVGAHLAVEQYLCTHLPEEQLAGLLQLLDTAALVGMKNQPQAVREVIVANLAGITPETAGAVAALHQLSVMFAYGLCDEEGKNPLWSGMEYPGPIQAPPATPKTLNTLAPQGPETYETDVVVVGSGSGGGVAAAALAEAGRRVIVVEGGSYFNESDFVQSELLAYQNLFLRGGFFPTADGMVSIAAGGTVGGGSTVNWSNSVRTPRTVRHHWAEAFGLADLATPAFDDHLDAVLTRIKANDKVATQNPTHQRLADSAARLGYEYRPTLLNIDPDVYDPALTGYSGMGDQTGAKQGTLRTYLQDASDAGALLLPNTRVGRVLVEDGRTTGVEATYTDPVTMETSRIEIKATVVVVAAGSLESPALLLRSGIGGPAVGSELRLHPASLVSGFYDEPQDPWFGPGQAGIMSQFSEAEEGFGFIVEGVQHLPGLFSTVVPWLNGEQTKRLTQQYRHRADWVFIVKDRGAGSVTLDEAGEAAHWYPFTDELDRGHFRQGAETAIRMQESAGARQIFVAGQPFAPWTRGEDLEAFIARVNEIPIGPLGIPVFSAHQMCSAKLGEDPATAVATADGELHDTAGVWIADASAMPSCSGVNPMVTTMALARRTAHNIIARG